MTRLIVSAGVTDVDLDGRFLRPFKPQRFEPLGCLTTSTAGVDDQVGLQCFRFLRVLSPSSTLRANFHSGDSCLRQNW